MVARLVPLPAVEDSPKAAQQEVPAAAGRVDHAEGGVEPLLPLQDIAPALVTLVMKGNLT